MTDRPASPLDPDARAVVDRLNALNAPGYEAMVPTAARAIAAHLRRNAPVPRVAVGAVEDLSLAAGARTLRARRYRPLAAAVPDAQPALVYLHGGGWTLGDLDTMDHLCRSLARQAGVEVVSLDYPLAPETQFPVTVEQCAEALRSLFAKAPALGLDPARIGIAGDSAGGNLAAALALLGRDGTLPPFAVQALIYPALDLRPRQDGADRPEGARYLPRATIDWFTANYLGDAALAQDWRASPLLAETLAGLPPSHVLTAGHDLLRIDGLAYADRLKAAGVETVLRDFPGQIHDFVSMPYSIPTAYAAIADLSEFLVRHLLGRAGA